MVSQQFLDSVRQLSLADRVALIEEISRSVRADLVAAGSVLPIEPQLEQERKLAAVKRLRGALKTADVPQTKAELREEYARYLEEKYA